MIRIFILLLLLVPTAASAQNPFGNRGLFIKQGTMSVSGTVSVEVINHAPEGDESKTGVLTTFSPSFAYFLNENVSIQGSIGVAYPSGDLFEDQDPTYFVAAGAVYYHRINNFYLYGGLMAGYIHGTEPASNSNGTNSLNKTHKAQGEWYGSFDTAATTTAVIVPVGVLFPITSSLAFDVGAKAIYLIDDDDNAIFDLALGWFGLQAFF